jgi:hypothetical protein
MINFFQSCSLPVPIEFRRTMNYVGLNPEPAKMDRTHPNRTTWLPDMASRQNGPNLLKWERFGFPTTRMEQSGTIPFTLAGNVADMSPTCQPDTAMSANFSRKGMSRRHTTRKKRPQHTGFVCRFADTDPLMQRRGGGFTTMFCSLAIV